MNVEQAGLTHAVSSEDIKLNGWRFYAACRGIENADTFFLKEGSCGHVKDSSIRQAKVICRQCPVLEQCLNYALEAGEKYGVWGGLSQEERHLLALRRRRVAMSS